jgi:hypothetical protein
MAVVRNQRANDMCEVTMTRKRLVILRWVATLVAAGTMFQVGGCSLGGITNFLSNFNPCGTILACDPVEYEFVTSGYKGPGVRPDIDPACVYPPYCADDPFVTSEALP